MNDHPVLGQVVLGYAPMIDRNLAVSALRLTLFPIRPEAAPDARELLDALVAAWPSDAGRLCLNVVGESLLAAMLGAELPGHLMIELPAFLASDPAHADALMALHRRGTTLLIKGRLLLPLGPALEPCFSHSIVDQASGQADAFGPALSRSEVLAGVRTMAQMAQAFGRGASAVMGWPIDDLVPACGPGGRGARPELTTVVELINRVEREESIERIEAVIKHDPTLAFKLMRYLNASAFGLSVELSSLRHAIMMLGYQRLKRWLVLLLAAGHGERQLKPVVYAAVRRGLLMEGLGRASGFDEDHRAELFICGVFSLLDRLMRQPLDELLRSIPASAAVRAALLDAQGPHQPYLALVQAIESSAVHDIRAVAESLLMTLCAVNRAVLWTLVAARQLD